MTDDGTAKRKLVARAEATSRRASLLRNGDPVAFAHALASVAGPMVPAGPVSAYWPLSGELDTRPLLHYLHAQGLEIGLPVVVARDQPLIFRRWTIDTVLEEQAFRVMVPPATAAPVIPRTMFVPLLAFDRRMGRLGYGGGFYDRTLARLADAGPVTAIGLALAGMEVDAVPMEPHDRPLDAVATERGVIRPSS